MKSSMACRGRLVSIFMSLALCLCAAVPAREAYAAGDPLAVASVSASSGALATSAASSESSVSYAGVDLAVRGKVQGVGWGVRMAGNSVVGDADGKGLNAISVRLTGLQGISGHVSYRTYKRGSGWKGVVSDGESSGSVRYVEAIKIKLSGTVAAHYDVLYRTYVSGKGWLPWVKNGAASGLTGKSTRVNAVQVKLSAKTEDALGKAQDKVGIRYEARFKATGWQSWKGDGKTAGTVGKSKALSGLAAAVDVGNSSGGVRYRAHNQDVGWTDWKEGGAFAGGASKRLEALRIKLTGAVAKKYDVYYRAHVQNYGWLDWAKNGAVAGSIGYGLRVEAFQVKLVAKGADAPGDTEYPTANALEKSRTLNGIDISSWQSGLNVAAIAADFVIVKATQGDWYTNPYFTAHANATLASGKLLGTYHFADLQGSATAQADYYVNAVRPYVGQCILVLDWEDDALSLGSAWAKQFLDRVYKKTGVKPLIYLSQSRTHEYNWASVAKKYKLWLAQYLYANMYSNGYLDNVTHWDIGYWDSATIYQYSSTGRLDGYGSNLDLNKFYGSAAAWKQLCG